MRRIVVVDYEGGNLTSAAQSARKVACDLSFEAEISVSRRPEDIRSADYLILPGQGAFSPCMKGLRDGIDEALEEATLTGTPFLGICVGMQVMAEWGFENGRTPGMGWISGSIKRLTFERPSECRLPHMGWNTLDFEPGKHPLTNGITVGDHGYFVHSYALTDWVENDLIASTSYGGLIPAIVARGNRCGTQFHVEKSQKTGLRILANFLSWRP